MGGRHYIANDDVTANSASARDHGLHITKLVRNATYHMIIMVESLFNKSLL